MAQQTQQEVRRFVGVASTVAGLICYALSSTFNNLFGKWSLFKIFAYIVSSSIICLAVLFPKAWQHLRILHHYRAHIALLVLISTTIYSFYLDRKSKTKPDAYSLISSAAFAMTSLCMSMQIECGFLDLMYFFCGLLVMQLMQIKPLLVFVGIGFGCFLVILRSYLDAPPHRSQSQPPQVVIDMASLLQSRPSSHAIPQEEEEEEEEGSNPNQAAIAPVYSFAALRSASLRYRSSTSRASLRSKASRSTTTSRRSRTRQARALDIHQNQPITTEEANSPSAVDDIPSMSSHYLFQSDLWTWITPRTKVVLGGDWIRTNHARVLEIFEDFQRSSWNKLLNNMQNSRNDESLIWDMMDVHNSFYMHFKDMCSLLSRWIVSDKKLRDNLTTSLANILSPAYDYFIHSHRFLALLGKHAHNKFIKYEVPDIEAELRHLFRGRRERISHLAKFGAGSFSFKVL